MGRDGRGQHPPLAGHLRRLSFLARRIHTASQGGRQLVLVDEATQEVPATHRSRRDPRWRVASRLGTPEVRRSVRPGAAAADDVGGEHPFQVPATWTFLVESSMKKST